MTPPQPPGLAEAQSGEALNFDLHAMLAPLRKHWVLAVATASLVMVGTAFHTMRQPKVYEAVASIQFDPNPPRPLGGKVESVVEMGSGSMWDAQEYYQTQYQILQSRKVSLGVVQQLGLNHDPRFLRNLPPEAPSPESFEPAVEEDAADALRGRIRVDPVKNSRIALVRISDGDPERAALLAKTVVDTYRQQNVDSVLESTDQAIDWLRKEHDKLRSELETSEMSLHEYKAEKNILSVEYDDQSSMLREEIAQLNNALTGVRTRREEIAARYSQLAKVKADDPSVLPASELLQSTQLSDLRSAYVDAVREHDSLLKGGKGKNHPDVMAAQSKVDTSRDALLAEVRNIQGALAGDLAIVGRQESGVSGLFQTAKKQALELNLLEIEYNRLRRQKENTEKLYSLLSERSKESELTRQLRVNNVSVIDYPTVPKGPVKPNVPMNLAMGAVFGLVLGIGAAYGRALLDRTMKTPDDVETGLGATFLGLIPEMDESRSKSRKRRVRRSAEGNLPELPELLVHHDPMGAVAEAARSIRTNLLFMAPDKPFRTLLITSAGPSEGKTTVAMYVATAMAQAGKRVVLVDCDLRRPRVHRVFRNRGLDMGPGLTTALLEDDSVDPVVSTEVPNFSIVPAGPIPPNPSELLHSEKFHQFLERMKGRFDHVILDSPPVVAVTDASILSTQVDGTIMVVRAFKTRKDLARHGYRQLRDVGANVAGVLLNAVSFRRDEYKYAYYYYRRDSYKSDDARS